MNGQWGLSPALIAEMGVAYGLQYGMQNMVKWAQDSGPETWSHAEDVQDFWYRQCILEKAECIMCLELR